MSKYEVFSGPYFPVFGLNTEIYGVNLRIQSEYRKIQTRKNSVFGHFLRSVFLFDPSASSACVRLLICKKEFIANTSRTFPSQTLWLSHGVPWWTLETRVTRFFSFNLRHFCTRYIKIMYLAQFILHDCDLALFVRYLSLFLDVKRMYMSTVSYFAQLDSIIL